MNNGKAILYDHRHKIHFAKYLEKAAAAKNDASKKIRLDLQQCPYCFYVSSTMGGAAMTSWECTSWECALCNKSAVNGSTNTPTLCSDCAKRKGRCRLCGDEMFELVNAY